MSGQRKWGNLLDIKYVSGQLADLLFPTHCIRCGGHGGVVVCRDCLAGMVSARAAERSATGDSSSDEERWLFRDIRYGGAYGGIIREMILKLKSSQRIYAAPLVCLMAAAAGNDPAFIAPDVVTWVPSSKRKVRHRGYNPAEVLAEGFAGITGRPATGCLLKVRDTRDQDTLRGGERIENVRGAFDVSGRLLAGCTILLVDDVLTTGATADACSGALLERGAKEVNVLVAARARRGGAGR